MALKRDLHVEMIDPHYRVDEVSEKGGILCSVTTGSGGYPSQPIQKATYRANPSGGIPVGILVDDVVNPDLRLGLNRYKPECYVGQNASVLVHGWVTTNKVTGTPTGRQTAYVGASGNFSTTQATGAVAAGEFRSTPDQGGYVKVYVNLG